ncbi:hypothetical protein AFLA_007287 [Aspergillus flavus NRRL3357]|nr:hypothetical protein AFLA_007287 [Aspergillus flavus NRRL3357]
MGVRFLEGPGLGYMTRWGIFQEQPKNFRGDRYIEIETSRQYGARLPLNEVGASSPRMRATRDEFTSSRQSDAMVRDKAMGVRDIRPGLLPCRPALVCWWGDAIAAITFRDPDTIR